MMETKTNTKMITITKGGTGEIMNTLTRTHAVKWKGWMLCVDEWENDHRGVSGGRSPLQAFFVHQSVWNENMHYDDADRWDLEEGDPLYDKLGVIEVDDYWMHTGKAQPSVHQPTKALKNYIGNDSGLLLETKIPDALEHTLTFRVTFDELDQLKRQAREAGTTVSDIVRKSIESVTNPA